MSLTALLLTGCATRTATVIDASSDWVRLTAPTKAKIATYQSGQWAESGMMTLPAGWYAGPGPKPK
jgi:hypothetical protein